jgi:two-component system CheB/CheR fusion protein
MESVLRSLQLGVVVVDTELRVKMWYGRSEELWGLRPAEVYEQPLMSLDIGLPLPQTRKLVREAFNGPGDVHEAVVTATNRRGRTIRCRIVASTLNLTGETGRGVVLLMEDQGSSA